MACLRDDRDPVRASAELPEEAPRGHQYQRLADRARAGGPMSSTSWPPPATTPSSPAGPRTTPSTTSPPACRGRNGSAVPAATEPTDHASTTARGARGSHEQHRLHPDQQLLTQPHGGAVHGPALLPPRRHRPHHPQEAGQQDPPLHRLAKPPCRRQAPTHRRREGERCLIRPWY